MVVWSVTDGGWASHTHTHHTQNPRETREKRALIAIVGAKGSPVCEKKGAEAPERPRVALLLGPQSAIVVIPHEIGVKKMCVCCD